MLLWSKRPQEKIHCKRENGLLPTQTPWALSFLKLSKAVPGADCILVRGRETLLGEPVSTQSRTEGENGNQVRLHFVRDRGNSSTVPARRPVRSEPQAPSHSEEALGAVLNVRSITPRNTLIISS
jgi:hypothetical protein